MKRTLPTLFVLATLMLLVLWVGLPALLFVVPVGLLLPAYAWLAYRHAQTGDPKYRP